MVFLGYFLRREFRRKGRNEAQIISPLGKEMSFKFQRSARLLTSCKNKSKALVDPDAFSVCEGGGGEE